MTNYLEFEGEIKNLENELVKLKDPFNSEGISEVNTEKIKEIEGEINLKLKKIYNNLSSWQKILVARHDDRPRSKYFIENLFQNFINLAGDRQFSEDKSVIAGFATFENQSVLVIGQEKGDDLDSRIERNFGMMKPEGYRKCIRLMKLAEKFNIPVITFIDTPGAYPGVGAEQRGQAEAIASSIECCMSLRVPIISIVIGEGGSGGAIALASANKVLMLENAIYSVISPEGCASILWRNPSYAMNAAEAMKLTAKDLLDLKIIDEIIYEPLGGAHRDKNSIIDSARTIIGKNINYFKKLNKDEIVNQRKSRFLNIGRQKGFVASTDEGTKMTKEKSLIFNIKNYFFKYKKFAVPIFIFAAIISIIFFLNL